MNTFGKFCVWCKNKYDGAAGVALVIAALLILILLSSQLSAAVANFATKLSYSQAASGLEEEISYVEFKAESLSRDERVRLAIRSADNDITYDFLSKIPNIQESERLILTNAKGRVLARLNSSASSNDFIYERTSWGRAIAANIGFGSIDKTYLSPLNLIGAMPVRDEVYGTNIGGIIVSMPMDEHFANYFEDKYLSDSVETVFYDSDGNYVSDSFESESIKSLLSIYVAKGSPALLDRSFSWSKNIVLADKMYALRNLPIYNSDKQQVGGVLIFVPNSPFGASAIIAALIAMAIFVIEIGLRKSRHSKGDRTSNKVETREALIALFYFCVLALTFFYVLNHVATKLSKPQQVIYNSTIQFRPETNVYRVGESHIISVLVDSGGEKINAAQIDVKYDPEMIQVEDVALDNSICDPGLILQKDIDNQKGKVSFQCGLNPDGFQGNAGIFMNLHIVSLKAGQFSLNFDSSSKVLASDGLGTDVLRQATDSWYQAVKPGSIPGSGYITVYSSTHPNPLRSYSNNHVEVNWGPIKGYEYRYSLDSSPDWEPQGEFYAVESTQFDIHSDGKFYFHIQSSGPNGLSKVTTYPITVDSTPPPAPIVRVSDKDIPAGYVVRIEMENADASPSHKNGFYVMIDSGILLPANSPLYIPFISPGEHFLMVHVFDVAGNENSTTVNFRVNK